MKKKTDISFNSLLSIKGAPDVLIGRCTSYVTSSGEVQPLDANTLASLDRLKNTYSSQGKRCLLLARKIIKEGIVTADPSTTAYEEAVTQLSKAELTLVGLVAIVDPLRFDIPDVVTTLRGAGIRIFMVTGDFALTAVAIAREAGIVTAKIVDDAHALSRTPEAESADDVKGFASSESSLGAIVLSGPDLIHLNEHQWQTLTRYQEIVFARTTPEQKLRIVREFQRDNVVAMTGDGVNDAPSLKAADVGISMGSGSDIAMEAADMVLLDTFSSIVVAVQYGRVVFDNLKKVCHHVILQQGLSFFLTLYVQVISYLLPAGSFAEFWPVMTSVCFGLPQILSSFLMIIVW
jgi:sodium/potassium-transporting ATPase subunit alpha